MVSMQAGYPPEGQAPVVDSKKIALPPQGGSLRNNQCHLKAMQMLL